MITHSFLHRHAIVALIMVPTLGWVATNTPVFQPNQYKTSPIHYTPQFFKWVTLGQWPAAVEGMWITLLQQISQNQISIEALQDVVQFYDLATDLDPLFYELYEQAGVYFSFFKEDGKSAEHFFEKGIRVYEEQILNGALTSNRTKLPKQFRDQFWSHPFTLYIFLAYTQAFVSQDWIKARATFIRAANVEGAPAYLQSMKSWLLEEGSEKVLAKRVLNQLIQNTKDETQKKMFQQKLKALESAS